MAVKKSALFILLIYLILDIQDILLRYGIWYMDLIKYQQIKNQNLTACARNLITGHVWIFQQYSDPKTNIKIKTKIGHWAQNQASAMATPVPRPELYRKWVGWTKEKKRQHGSGNLKDLERFSMEEWSMISDLCSPNSSGIIGEDSELLSWKNKVAKSI